MKTKHLCLLFLIILLAACAAEAQPTPGLPTETPPPPTATASSTRTSTPLPIATATPTPENILPPDKAFMINLGTVAEIEYRDGMSVGGAFFVGLWKFSQALGSLEPFLPFTDVYNYVQPRWSPDGRRIAYLRVARTIEGYTSIWVRDLDSGEDTRVLPEIPTQRGNSYRGTWAIQLIGWSKSGQKLFYTVPHRSGEWDKLYSADLETGTVEEIHVQFADYPDIETQKWGYRSDYSQTSEKLLLTRCEGENCDSESFLIIDLRNPGDSLMITNPEPWYPKGGVEGRRLRNAKLSPDGKQLAFVDVDYKKEIQIWTLDIDSQIWESSVALPRSSQSEDFISMDRIISWSADGKWLAVWREYEQLYDGPYLDVINFIYTDSWEIGRQVEINSDFSPNLGGWVLDSNGNWVFGVVRGKEGLWLFKPDGSPENDLLWVEWEVFEESLPTQIADVNIPVVRQPFHISFQP